MKCLYCEKEMENQFTFLIAKLKIGGPRLLYYFCSEECLIEYLKRNLFNFLDEIITIKKEENRWKTNFKKELK